MTTKELWGYAEAIDLDCEVQRAEGLVTNGGATDSVDRLAARIGDMRSRAPMYGCTSVEFVEGWLLGVGQSTHLLQQSAMNEWWIAKHGSRGGQPWTQRVVAMVVSEYPSMVKGGIRLTEQEDLLAADALLFTATRFLQGLEPPDPADLERSTGS